MGELRSTTIDPEAPPRLREEAALRLARLADARDREGHPLVPAARPEHWWGLRLLTRSDDPLVASEQPVHLSGSQLASVLACPRNWFLARKAQGESARTAAASFGSVVHVLAEYGAHTQASHDELAQHLESVWSQLDFDAHWLSAVERVEAESALERFVTWQTARSDLTLLGTEVEFSCEVDLGSDRVHLTGSADRVERDRDGRIRIVDFKTSKRAPTATDIALHDQLGVYQLAVQQGAFTAVAGEGVRPGGAELVYLRLPDGESGYPKTFQQASLDDVPFPVKPPDAAEQPFIVEQPTWVHRRLAEAAEIIRSEASRCPHRTRLSLLSLPHQLPCAAGRATGGEMTVHTLVPPASRTRLDNPAALIDALGISFSTQQLDAITAPLEPGVIIAGAGSGKTTVMAARVVWLVGTGAVRPEEVLGLTFTRKAAAELSQRVRSALLAGRGDRRPRCRRIRRAVDHDVRRVRCPAGGRARAAAGLRGRSDLDQRRHSVPARIAGGQRRRRAVRVHLPAAAGHGDRAGAPARRRPPAAPRRRQRS